MIRATQEQEKKLLLLARITPLSIGQIASFRGWLNDPLYVYNAEGVLDWLVT